MNLLQTRPSLHSPDHFQGIVNHIDLLCQHSLLLDLVNEGEVFVVAQLLVLEALLILL